jgi:hypothetical protein
MSEKNLLLERSIEAALKVVEELLEDLALEEVREDAPEEVLIVVGYRLHNLYSAFESILRSIADVFEGPPENAVDPGVWDRQLLNRMSLDLSPLRPAVIDDAVRDQLNELRRFRHLFRTTYSTPMDPERLNLALRRAQELRDAYPPVLDRFLEFLRAV